MSADAWTIVVQALETHTHRNGNHALTLSKYRSHAAFMARHGLHLDQVVAGVEACAQAVDAYMASRPPTGPGGRRNDARVLNAVAAGLHATGHHAARIKWPLPRSPHPLKRSIPQWDLDRLATYQHRLRDFHVRDMALLETALLTGAGRSELSRMDVQDLDPRGFVFIHGAKGHASDWIPVEDELYRRDGPLTTWMRLRRPPATDPGALWTTLKGPRRRLLPGGVYSVVKRIQAATAVPLSLNRTRHTRGRRLAKSGMPSELVKLALRLHSDAVVSTYTEPDMEDVAEHLQERGGPGAWRALDRRMCPTCGQRTLPA